jgi:hypothetical protein
MRTAIGTFAVVAAALVAACGSSSTNQVVSSSRAYKGHENEKDTTNFVNAYPKAVGTRLDDCQTCHTSGTLTPTGAGAAVTKNACDFCHLIQHPLTGYTGQPASYADTLNAYGAAYTAGGRTRDALRALDKQDSDGDGTANGAEIAEVKYPGDAASKPGQANAPQKIFTLTQLQALTAHTEFLLANSNKQQFDDYASYKGVKIKDLLVAAGVDPADPQVTGVTVIAPDGFMKDISIADVNKQFQPGLFYAGLDTATKGTTCGFVNYPSPLPTGVADGQPIPGEQWITIAYQRDGGAVPIDPSNLDPTSGKINGEGPYRLVWPQATPGSPDRGSQYSPTTCNDGYDYVSSKDHNAGSMVRGVIAVRINPLPAGYEDFDAKNGGWAFISDSTLVVYGYNIK